MNDPEVNVPDVLATTDLIAHRKALEAAGAAIKLVMRVRAPLKPIADQVIRSASSAPVNMSKGDTRVRACCVEWCDAESAPGGRKLLERSTDTSPTV